MSAGPSSIDHARVHRPRIAALRALAALVAAVASLTVASLTVAPAAGLAPVAAATSCARWTTSYAPPPTIRVLRTATGTVEAVPFQAYVENVMGWEWPASYPTEALRAGAVAVKEYAWYRSMISLRSTPSGDCYDVRDDTWDQIYDPSRSPAASQVAAVEATWTLTMRKNGAFFLSGYGPGSSDVCGADLSSTRTRLAQRGVRACALDGKSMAEILHVYLDPGLTISDAVRIAGHDRFATAAAISASTFEPGVPVVFIATGMDFPDALAGGPAAAALGGPILLVTNDAIPDATAAELTRLTPGRIVVLGGPSAIDDAVVTALGSFAPDVSRIAGHDRYATAAAVSATVFDPGVPVAFIATGKNFPDALAGSAAGARVGGPVLLVPGDAIPDVVAAELQRLEPKRIRVLGSTVVVSDEVLKALDAYSPDVARLAGPDRYSTAAAITAAFYDPGVDDLELATGTNFPDALAGAPLGGPLLLVGSAGGPSATLEEAARLAPTAITPLGGAVVLSDDAVTGVVTAVGTP